MANQKELTEQAEAALKKGYHNKALKLAEGILVESVRGTIIARAEKAKAEAKDAAAAAPKRDRKEMKDKPITPHDVLAKYDSLMDALAEIETIERAKARPYRFYFFHRRQVENLMRGFKKGMRI